MWGVMRTSDQVGLNCQFGCRSAGRSGRAGRRPRALRSISFSLRTSARKTSVAFPACADASGSRRRRDGTVSTPGGDLEPPARAARSRVPVAPSVSAAINLAESASGCAVPGHGITTASRTCNRQGRRRRRKCSSRMRCSRRRCAIIVSTVVATSQRLLWSCSHPPHTHTHKRHTTR